MTDYPVKDFKATGRHIRKLRIDNGYTVESIKKYLGLHSGQAVYKWQRGETLPTIDNLYALSKLFNITIGNIIVTEERFM